ncbi:MAG: trigger factor [Candidatus Falkowbacteria bacterium]
MNISKTNNDQGQAVMTVTVDREEFAKYWERAAAKISEEVKVQGFRPGKVSFEVMKKHVDVMVIMEEAARLYIYKEGDKIIGTHAGAVVVGQPQINITKLSVDGELEFAIIADLLPEVKLAEYKGHNISLENTAIAEEEVAKVLQELIESRASEALADRPSKIGDKVVADIKMFLDNVPVDGGQSNGVALMLGKDYFVPGFDQKVEGIAKDETKEFDLIFPADFHQKNLAGRKVEFAVTAKDVFERKLPELNEELAASFGMSSIEELNKNIRENMEHEKFHRAEEKAEIGLIEKLVAESTFGPIPQALVENEKDLMLKEMKRNVEQYGSKFEDYLLNIKKKVDELRNEFEPEAIKRVKSAIIIRRIIELEKIEATDEEVHDEVAHLLAHYGTDPKAAERIKSADYAQDVAGQLALRKAVDMLKEWNFVDYIPHNHH